MKVKTSYAFDCYQDIINSGGVDAIDMIHGSLEYFLRWVWMLDADDQTLVLSWVDAA